ncbi:MAG: (2Fe-2S) ferredoxin domain-containing protein [Myxacorys chilensis ATA2-1-KO14]|nr:(2Fe-2S) ferredoxin domain-containing protein [Myxacorys chilensis ATA2-1-KO14]
MHKRVLVCQSRSCLANGSAEVLAAFLAGSTPDISISASECQGQCHLGATVRVLPDEVWYCRVKPKDVAEIAHQHLQHGHPVDHLLHPRLHPRYTNSVPTESGS